MRKVLCLTLAERTLAAVAHRASVPGGHAVLPVSNVAPQAWQMYVARDVS